MKITIFILIMAFLVLWSCNTKKSLERRIIEDTIKVYILNVNINKNYLELEYSIHNNGIKTVYLIDYGMARSLTQSSNKLYIEFGIDEYPEGKNFYTFIKPKYIELSSGTKIKRKIKIDLTRWKKEVYANKINKIFISFLMVNKIYYKKGGTPGNPFIYFDFIKRHSFRINTEFFIK